MDDKLIPSRGKLSLYKVAPSSYVNPGRPRYPKGLSVTGKPLFKRLCQLLETRRTLTEGDEELLFLYTVIDDRHRRALANIESEGEIVPTEKGPRINPWLSIAEKCEKSKLAILEKLGLTPASRDRVKVTRRREENNVLEIVLTSQEKETPCLPNGPTE